jgi:hypothetical protein
MLFRGNVVLGEGLLLRFWGKVIQGKVVWGKVVWGKVVWGKVIWGKVIWGKAVQGKVIWGNAIVPYFNFAHACIRVVRWFILIPKSQFDFIFGGNCNGKYWYIL